MRVEDMMFALLRSELCGNSAFENLQEIFTEENYKELFILSRKHDLAHIVASALSKRNLLGDDAVSQAFQQELMKSVYRDTQREYAIKLTGDLFEKAQIPHIHLKGSVIRYMYPETWMRTSCDIDILVQKKDIEKALDVLCGAG